MTITVMAVVWITFWIGNILCKFHEFMHISRLMDKLRSLVTRKNLESDKLRDNAARRGLALYPEMSRIIGPSAPFMSHLQDPMSTLRAMADFYEYLDDYLDFSRNSLVRSLNPINSLKILFLTPSWILKQFGLNLKIATQKFISFVTWLIVTLLTIFGMDVREFILRLFQ